MPKMLDPLNVETDEHDEFVEVVLANASFENLPPEGRAALLAADAPRYRDAIEHPDPAVRKEAAQRIFREYLGVDEPSPAVVRDHK